MDDKIQTLGIIVYRRISRQATSNEKGKGIENSKGQEVYLVFDREVEIIDSYPPAGGRESSPSQPSPVMGQFFSLQAIAPQRNLITSSILRLSHLACI